MFVELLFALMIGRIDFYGFIGIFLPVIPLILKFDISTGCELLELSLQVNIILLLILISSLILRFFIYDF